MEDREKEERGGAGPRTRLQAESRWRKWGPNWGRRWPGNCAHPYRHISAGLRKKCHERDVQMSQSGEGGDLFEETSGGEGHHLPEKGEGLRLARP